MSRFGFGSATTILTELYGNSVLDDELDQDEAAMVDFLQMSDVADAVSDDEEEEASSLHPPSSAVYQRPRVKIVEMKGACSICLMNFDEENEAVTLPCGHTFCTDCLAIYLQVESGDINTLRHELSKIVPVKPGVLSLHLRRTFGCKCPAFHCKHVLEYDDIKKFATEKVFQRFDRFLLRMALEEMHDLEPCPRNCGGYLQDNCAICSNEDCRLSLKNYERVIVARKAQWYKLNSRAHELFVKFMSSQSGQIKCCPNCFVIIEKNQGCDNMFCSRCQHRYLWSQAPQVGAGNCWLQFSKRGQNQAVAETVQVVQKSLIIAQSRAWQK